MDFETFTELLLQDDNRDLRGLVDSVVLGFRTHFGPPADHYEDGVEDTRLIRRVRDEFKCLGHKVSIKQLRLFMAQRFDPKGTHGFLEVLEG